MTAQADFLQMHNGYFKPQTDRALRWMDQFSVPRGFAGTQVLAFAEDLKAFKKWLKLDGLTIQK